MDFWQMDESKAEPIPAYIPQKTAVRSKESLLCRLIISIERMKLKKAIKRILKGA